MSVSLETFYHGPMPLVGGGWVFQVWAPRAGAVELVLAEPARRIPMAAAAGGYHRAEVEGVTAGAAYRYCLDGGPERPDPASRLQSEGVHGASRLWGGVREWTDGGWGGVALRDAIFYELHTGTFTAEGTFDAVIGELDYLRDLGVTVVELMPVAQFPGRRNWGYDGVYPFAAQASYGGADGLARLVDACHGKGLAVALDVVYNHLGPEGNYLAEFGPYFTGRYRTPWGSAMNFDGPGSDGVRRYFVENALYWIRELHVDVLRLDAVHAIFDQSARPFLEELADAVRVEAARLGRQVLLVAESALDDPRMVRPGPAGGFGLDGQWNDDFHHALRTLVTGDVSGYYRDFGSTRHLAKAMREGFVYSGEYSGHHDQRRGRSSRELAGDKLVVFGQNHDQIGNRMLGERLGRLVDRQRLIVGAAAVLLAPAVPLLFMGEEYDEPAPFQYFVEHSDAGLIEAVRRGRAEEFEAFAWQGEPPDPQAEETFLRSKLHAEMRGTDGHAGLLKCYKRLIELRRTTPELRELDKERTEVEFDEAAGTLCCRRWSGGGEVMSLFAFADGPARGLLPAGEGRWRKLFDSADAGWGGPGAVAGEECEAGMVEWNGPGVVVYRRIREESVNA